MISCVDILINEILEKIFIKTENSEKNDNQEDDEEEN